MVELLPYLYLRRSLLKILLSTLFAFPIFTSAQTITKGSVYTNIKTECLEVEMATDKAPIDFYTLECKAFGGYKLEISGGDLRYSPTLYWNDQAIEVKKPFSFHDPDSDMVEWVYEKSVDEEGAGQVRWIGFIYRLFIQEGNSVDSILYAIRLDKEASCLIGEVRASEKANELARELVYSSKAGCP